MSATPVESAGPVANPAARIAGPSARKRWLAGALILLASIGIAARAYTTINIPRSELCRADFPIFYAGGRLAGTDSLYVAQAEQQIQSEEMGCTGQLVVPVRLPFFYALMKPWSMLPFWQAFWLWRFALIAATLIFVLLWPAPKTWSLLICAWSGSVAFAVTNGQDVAYLLMWLALSVALWRKGWEFTAGCALAMGAAKFHLFLLLPLFLLYRKRLLLGWCSATALLVTWCFALQGMAWPAQLLSCLTRRIDVNPNAIPNFRGLVQSHLAPEVLLAVCAAGACLYVARRSDFQYGLCASLTGGILVSHHMMPSDQALLIPVALMLTCHPRAKYSKVLAIALITPIGDIAPWWMQGLLITALFCMICVEARGAQPETSRSNELPEARAAVNDLPALPC